MGYPGVIAPEKDPNPTHEQWGEKAPDLPPEILVDALSGSSHETSTDVDGRPDLLRMEFAGPDSLIDMESVRAQRAIRYVNLTLVPEASLLTEWDDFGPAEQRMFRAAVLQELFDDSYEELETVSSRRTSSLAKPASTRPQHGDIREM